MTNKFILTGNSSYLNKGCEAIIRGTINIIDETFGSDNDYILESYFSEEKIYQKQISNESDTRIKHVKWTPGKARFKYNITAHSLVEKSLNKIKLYGCIENIDRKKKGNSNILQDLPDCKAVLSVGGDNYSLDHGIPNWFTDSDDVIRSFNKPHIIWGASVGPFSAIPQYEKYMAKHLQKVTAIFAREDVTIEYLNKIGVSKNVYRVSDPAFLMTPVEPANFNELVDLNESIGINLSPLMARFWTNDDYNKWKDFCIKLVENIAEKTQRPIYLVPHVVAEDNSDYLLLKEVKENIKTTAGSVHLLSPDYSAAEIKFIISKMKSFVGARTHSTIAAFSTLVPTISLAYSIKALGINREVYGDLSYCISKDKKSDINYIADLVNSTVIDNINIREKMKNNLEAIIDKSRKAGDLLKSLC